MEEYKRIMGIGLHGIVASAVILFVGLWMENAFNIPKMSSDIVIDYIAILLVLAGFLIYVVSYTYLPIAKHGKELIQGGLYSYVRHPQYSAIIFFFYPAIALFMRSYVLVFSTVMVYIVFTLFVMQEEKYMVRLFGKSYLEYIKKIPRFIPVKR